MSLSFDLISWYSANRRILPWRESPTPYRVYLSEVMLQQTRVETVKPYFERFLQTFPDISSLANAEEDVYLKLWEGLGYYSRVKNLAKSAKKIVSDYGGGIPSALDELRTLPGVGEYTAKAILAIAYQKPYIAVDGNLVRVYARLEEQAVEPSSPKAKQACEDYFLSQLDDAKPGDFVQALMDLGELVCLPNGKPLCDACPFASYCKAHLHHNENAYPLPKKQVDRRKDSYTVLMLWQNEKVLIEKRKDGLLSQTYGFPMEKGHLSKEAALEVVKTMGYSPKSIKLGPKAKHVFSHRVWDMISYVIEIDDAEGLFVSEKEIADSFAIPSAFSYFL